MAQRVIFFSGMGADERAFQFLQLENVERLYVNWIPEKPNEDLKAYAKRLIQDVEIQPDDILLGLSMGGLIAQEVAAVKPVKGVILLSSLRSNEQLQPLFNAAQNLKLLNLVHADLIKTAITKGAKLLLPHKKERIKVIVDMLDQFEGTYYKWAMKQVLNWKGVDVTCPVYHIHGDKDEIFPIKLAKDAIVIKGGTHLMVTWRAEQVSNEIQRIIDQSYG